MDEKEFKKTYNAVNELRCVFEKAVLTRRYHCEKLQRINIAEREAAGCDDPIAQQECSQLLTLLRKNAAFALKLTHIGGALPHAKEAKVQCGGLSGLQQAAEIPAEGMQVVPNIYQTIHYARERFHSLEELPFHEIVKSITSFEGRRKRQK
jgi:hypothetical protein